jgi:hypothetical protein
MQVMSFIHRHVLHRAQYGMIPLEHSYRNAIKAISKFATVIQKFEDIEVETVSLSIEDYVCVLQSVFKISLHLGEA